MTVSDRRHALPRVGDRVRMTGVMPKDPDPLPVGSAGVVTFVGPAGMVLGADYQQIYVDWDSGRTLILLSTDPFEVVGSDD